MYNTLYIYHVLECPTGMRLAARPGITSWSSIFFSHDIRGKRAAVYSITSVEQEETFTRCRQARECSSSKATSWPQKWSPARRSLAPRYTSPASSRFCPGTRRSTDHQVKHGKGKWSFLLAPLTGQPPEWRRKNNFLHTTE